MPACYESPETSNPGMPRELPQCVHGEDIGRIKPFLDPLGCLIGSFSFDDLPLPFLEVQEAERSASWLALPLQPLRREIWPFVPFVNFKMIGD